jgi:hypothetical protein
MLIRGDLAFHDYEGVAVDLGERERLVADLGEKNAMLLRNHGTLAAALINSWNRIAIASRGQYDRAMLHHKVAEAKVAEPA